MYILTHLPCSVSKLARAELSVTTLVLVIALYEVVEYYTLSKFLPYSSMCL